MTNKLQEYYDNFLKQAVKSQEQLNAFMKQDDIRKKFTSSEIDKLKALWSGTYFEPVVNKTLEQVEEVVQKQIEVVEEAFSTYSKKNNKKK